MKTNVSIYLAGSIKKGHEQTESVWTEEHMAQIRENLKGCEVLFLNPAFRTDNLSDQRSVFGRDMVQVFCSDVVFVDARDRRGLGVGAEMMWAKLNKVPVVTWAPKNSHYHKSHTTILGVPVANFVHPFVESLSDQLVENPAEGARWIAKALSDPTTKIKGLEDVESSMHYYREGQLHMDKPMKELLLSSEALKKRLHALKVTQESRV
jgi:hypothetical protein